MSFPPGPLPCCWRHVKGKLLPLGFRRNQQSRPEDPPEFGLSRNSEVLERIAGARRRSQCRNVYIGPPSSLLTAPPQRWTSLKSPQGNLHLGLLSESSPSSIPFQLGDALRRIESRSTLSRRENHAVWEHCD